MPPSIAVIAPVVAAVYEAYQTGKAVYDKVSDFFSSKQTQTQVKTINTGIQGLRETQGLQKKNIDLLTKKTASAKNQEEYSKLYEELAKQKAQYDKNNKLLDKIEYSTQQQDYGAVKSGLEEYLDNANQTIGELNPLKGSVEKSEFPEFDDSYFEKDLPYDFEDSNKSFEQDHKETYLTEELMNNFLGIQSASAEEYVPQLQGNYDNATSNTDNNEISTFKGEVSKNVEKIGELIKPIVRKAVNGPILSMLESKDGKLAMSIANYLLNEGAKDAADLMQISIYGPENLEATREYMPLDKSFNKMLNEELGLVEISRELPEDWYGILFDKNSHIAQTFNNSRELKAIIQKGFEYDKIQNGWLSFKFPQSKNLTRAINKGDLINLKDNGDYYTAILFDKYDFTYLKILLQNEVNLSTKIANNIAYLLQQTQILHNYYHLTPIKIMK